MSPDMTPFFVPLVILVLPTTNFYTNHKWTLTKLAEYCQALKFSTTLGVIANKNFFLCMGFPQLTEFLLSDFLSISPTVK